MRIYSYVISIVRLCILRSHPHSIDANLCGCCIYKHKYRVSTTLHCSYGNVALRKSNQNKAMQNFHIQFVMSILCSQYLLYTSNATQGRINKIFVVYCSPRFLFGVNFAEIYAEKRMSHIRWYCQHNNITNSNKNNKNRTKKKEKITRWQKKRRIKIDHRVSYSFFGLNIMPVWNYGYLCSHHVLSSKRNSIVKVNADKENAKRIRPQDCLVC